MSEEIEVLKAEIVIAENRLKKWKEGNVRIEGNMRLPINNMKEKLAILKAAEQSNEEN